MHHRSTSRWNTYIRCPESENLLPPKVPASESRGGSPVSRAAVMQRRPDWTWVSQ
jgi:hypothetical protein